MDILQHALGYLSRGWTVIPVKQDKKPPRGFKWTNFKATDATVRQAFALRDVAGVAVLLGKPSGGLCCRDFDAADAYTAWGFKYAAEARSLPTVQTARGFHTYFRSTGELRTRHIGKEGELRGDGAYTVLPPSLHPSGIRYAWKIPLGDTIPAIDPVACGLAAGWLERKSSGANDPTTHTTGNDGANGNDGNDGNDGVTGTVDALVSECLPNSTGQNDRLTFKFARGLHAIQVTLGRALTFDECRAAFNRWWERNMFKPPEGYLDHLDKFSRAFDTIRAPLGMKHEVLAAERAKTRPPPRVALRYEDEATRRTVALLRAMQELAGDGRPWPLTCRQLALVLSLPSDMAAHRTLDRLTRRPDPVLKRVVRGEQKRGGRPSTWLYVQPLED